MSSNEPGPFNRNQDAEDSADHTIPADDWEEIGMEPPTTEASEIARNWINVNNSGSMSIPTTVNYLNRTPMMECLHYIRSDSPNVHLRSHPMTGTLTRAK